MLIASEIKGELARIQPARQCCQRAELAGLLFAAERGDELQTYDHSTARIAMQLAATLELPAVAPSLPPRPTVQHHRRRRLRVSIGGDARRWSWDAAAACDRRAFVRGVTLADASLSLRSGGPHVEFVLATPHAAEELQRRLSASGVSAKISRRRGRDVVYLKGNEEIAALLRLTGANRGLLDFETSRVGREVQNRLNRLLNAEAANVGRTVRAADRQLQAIARLEANGELAQLPQALRDMARERRLNPDADLDDLSRLLGISRSAVNHRLRRLVELAGDDDGS
ncbi:MAG TPA: DNA-binding protein WhiA [Candidatus Limnocylindria bacterium]|nr:DNA-binding protein WhiA [Candidatus Limnocylindria bacterium]